MKKLLPRVALTSQLGDAIFDVYSFSPTVTQEKNVHEPLVHMHHFEEFVYIYSGEVTLALSADHSDMILRSGDFCLIPSGVYHFATFECTERLCFEMRIKKAAPQARDGNGIYTELKRVVSSHSKPIVFHSPYVTALMEQYRKISCDGATLFDTRKAIILTEVMFHAMDDICSNASQSLKKPTVTGFSNDRKWIIEQFISGHYSSDSALSALANELGLTERRTSTVVHEIMKKSFKELIVQERMTVAEILIKSSQHSLEEISRLVGYKSYSGFYIAWKRHFGYSPDDTP